MATDTVPMITDQNLEEAEEDVVFEKTARYEVLAQLNENHRNLPEMRL